MSICGRAWRYQGSSGIFRGNLVVRHGASKLTCIAEALAL